MEESLTIKRFDQLTQIELYEILKLRNDIFIVEQNCPYHDIDGYDPQAYHLFGKDAEGHVCGCLRILNPGQTFEEAAIGRLVVRTDQRHTGIARRMVNRAIAFMQQELSETRIKIEAQEYLLRFYTSVGFQPCSEMFLEDGIPHVVMLYEAEKKNA